MSERFRDLVGASLGDDSALSGGGSLERWLAPTSESRVEQVPVEVIEDPHWRPDSVDTDPNYRALKSSVRASGILQPLLLRPLGGDRYQLVSGARRLRAARETGQSAVPVIIRELNDVEALLGAWDAVMRAGVTEAERQTLSARLGELGMAEAEVRALLSGVPAREAGAAAAPAPAATAPPVPAPAAAAPPPPAPPAYAPPTVPPPPAFTPPPVPAAPAPPSVGPAAEPAPAWSPPAGVPAPAAPPAAPPAPAAPAPAGPRPKVISISLPPEAVAAVVGTDAPEVVAPPAPAAPAPVEPAASAPAPPPAPAWTPPAPPAQAWTPPAPPAAAPAPPAGPPAEAAPAAPIPGWNVRSSVRAEPAAPAVTPPPESPAVWTPPPPAVTAPPVTFVPPGQEAAAPPGPVLEPVTATSAPAAPGFVGRLARDPRTYATVGVFFAVWAVVFIIVAVLIGASNQRLLVAAVVVAAVGFVTAIVGLAPGAPSGDLSTQRRRRRRRTVRSILDEVIAEREFLSPGMPLDAGPEEPGPDAPPLLVRQGGGPFSSGRSNRRRRSAGLLPPPPVPAEMPYDIAGRVAFHSVAPPADVRPGPPEAPATAAAAAGSRPGSRLEGWTAVALAAALILVVFLVGLGLTQ